MGKVFDEADYERKLDAARQQMSVGEELNFIITGDGAGMDARKQFQLAKENALHKARKKMLDRIAQERENSIANGLIGTEVEEFLTGKGDELVQVEG